MELKSMNCPNCAHPVKVDMTRKNYFCQYCGSQLLFDDGVQRVHHEVTGGFEFGYQEELGRQKALEEMERKRQEEQQRQQAIRNQQRQEMLQQFLNSQNRSMKNRNKKQNNLLIAALILWIGGMLIYWFVGNPRGLGEAAAPKARIMIGCLLALGADIAAVLLSKKAHEQNYEENTDNITMFFNLVRKRQTGCITAVFDLILAAPIAAYVFTIFAALAHS